MYRTFVVCVHHSGVIEELYNFFAMYDEFISLKVRQQFEHKVGQACLMHATGSLAGLIDCLMLLCTICLG